MIDVIITFGKKGLTFRGKDQDGGNFIELVKFIGHHNVGRAQLLKCQKEKGTQATTNLSYFLQNYFKDMTGKSLTKVTDKVIRTLRHLC